MEGSAFRFLLEEGNQPYISSRCYIEANPAIDNRKQWVLHLDRPKDATWVYEIDDMKTWMLHGKPVLQIVQDRSNRSTRFRDLDRDAVFREYLRQILERIPSAYRARRKYALMPSIADDDSRTRYREAIEAVLPEVTVLPEPEMVAEYFRLLKRSLELAPGRNNVILVVDTGASTANMTIILTRRDRRIVDVDASGKQRDLRLRALRGDSVGNAGHWVDMHLAGLLGRDANDAAMLRAIEQAKIDVSLGNGKGAEVRSAEGKPLGKIDREMLVSATKALWGQLASLFESLCTRLYENQTSSDAATKMSEDQLRSLGIKGSGDAHRLIDTVLLAGGTSLLPGFEETMLATLFPNGHRPKVLRVGDAFPIAAAAGGLAHILHNYRPSRIREQGEADSEIFTAPLEATLPYPVLLGIKEAHQREQYVTLLDPSDPFVDDGGKRPIEGLPLLAAGTEPKARLVPGTGAASEARQGRKFKPIVVNQSPGRMELEWDPLRERATVCSSQVESTSHLWIEVRKLVGRDEPALDPYQDALPPDALAIDGAEDIILDFGMSKIVAVTADRGWISTRELERAVHTGVPAKQAEIPLPPPEAVHDQIPAILDAQPGEENLSKPEIEPAPLDHLASEAIVREIEEVQATSDSIAQVSEQVRAPSGWASRSTDTDFAEALTALKDELEARTLGMQFDDIVVALLALAVRPVVLLAGPPGCGKSTMVRFIAQILGKNAGETFHDVAVQAHWTSDDVLFGKDGQLELLLARSEAAHLILLDEFNLTRPEYYLSRLFHALESGTGKLSHNQQLASCQILGTLNIDESSRVPSPKVIDRCFLIELPPLAWDAPTAPILTDLRGMQPLPALPDVTLNVGSTDERISRILSALHVAVEDHHLRHDLLPSRRVLSDIRALLSLHSSLDLQARDLLNRDELIDRLLASRILVKLSGAFDQVAPALEALGNAVEGMEEFPRLRRRIRLAQQQARLGFVSPWQ